MEKEVLGREINPFPGKGRLSAEDEELRQLRRENKRLRMEREISGDLTEPFVFEIIW